MGATCVFGPPSTDEARDPVRSVGSWTVRNPAAGTLTGWIEIFSLSALYSKCNSAIHLASFPLHSNGDAHKLLLLTYRCFPQDLSGVADRVNHSTRSSLATLSDPALGGRLEHGPRPHPSCYKVPATQSPCFPVASKARIPCTTSGLSSPHPCIMTAVAVDRSPTGPTLGHWSNSLEKVGCSTTCRYSSPAIYP